MYIFFVKNYDIWNQGEGYNVERTLGVKLCAMGVAVPYTVHLEMVAEERAKAKAKAAKVKKLLEKKAVEKADSKQAKTRSKSITYK